MVRIWVQPGGKRDASPGLRVRARSSQWALGGTHAFQNSMKAKYSVSTTFSHLRPCRCYSWIHRMSWPRTAIP